MAREILGNLINQGRHPIETLTQKHGSVERNDYLMGPNLQMTLLERDWVWVLSGDSSALYSNSLVVTGTRKSHGIPLALPHCQCSASGSAAVLASGTFAECRKRENAQKENLV